MRVIKYGSLLGIMVLGTLPVQAQEIEGLTQDSLLNLLLFLAITFAVIALILAITVWALVKPETKEGEVKEGKPFLNWSWKGFSRTVNDIVPIEEEDSITLDHNYDGIRELDNNLPPWWTIGFYISIAFSFIYLWIYHVNSDWSSEQEYQDEIAAAEVQKAQFLEKMAALVDESNVVALTAATDLGEGEKIYQQLCAVCHANDGGGNIGPNLTDAYWLHGGSIQDIFKTIKYGIPEKGMISWQEQLNPQDMQRVASYIQTLVGTTPATPKEPQGELYSPEQESPTADSTQQEIVSLN